MGDVRPIRPERRAKRAERPPVVKVRHVEHVPGYVFVLLPSINKAMRAVMAEIGVQVPYRPEWGLLAFRIPDDRRPEFEDAVVRLYPRWRLWEARQGGEHVPPWLAAGIEQLAAEGAARLAVVRDETTDGC